MRILLAKGRWSLKWILFRHRRNAIFGRFGYKWENRPIDQDCKNLVNERDCLKKLVITQEIWSYLISVPIDENLKSKVDSLVSTKTEMWLHNLSKSSYWSECRKYCPVNGQIYVSNHSEKKKYHEVIHLWFPYCAKASSNIKRAAPKTTWFFSHQLTLFRFLLVNTSKVWSMRRFYTWF